MVTQEEFDNQLGYLVGQQIKNARQAADLRRQNDPAAFRKEMGCIMLLNCIAALQDYDVTSGLLTDEEIQTTIELGTQVTLNWPLT